MAGTRDASALSCLNAACGCPPAADGDYCSDDCYAADRDNPRGTSCVCGHAACEGSKDDASRQA